MRRLPYWRLLTKTTQKYPPESSGLLPGVYKAGFHYNFGNTSRFDGIVEEGNYFIYGNASQTLHYLDADKTRHCDAGFTLSGAPGNRNRDEFEAMCAS